MTMGLTFKILHMPGADELFNYGFLAFALIFLPLATYSNYFRKKQRTLIEKLRILLGFISAVLIGLAVVSKMALHLQGSEAFLLTGVGIFSFGFLPVLFIRCM
jgi:hypothetical protein